MLPPSFLLLCLLLMLLLFLLLLLLTCLHCRWRLPLLTVYRPSADSCSFFFVSSSSRTLSALDALDRAKRVLWPTFSSAVFHDHDFHVLFSHGSVLRGERDDDIAIVYLVARCVIAIKCGCGSSVGRERENENAKHSRIMPWQRSVIWSVGECLVHKSLRCFAGVYAFLSYHSFIVTIVSSLF